MGHKLAVDFGTTNSVIARWDDGTRTGSTVALERLSAPGDDGVQLVPSLLYVLDGRTGETVAGQAVREQGLDRRPGNRLFRNFKRTIGAETLIEARLIDGEPWTEERAGQEFLRCLLQSLPYPADDIEQLVLTVPVAAFEGYAAWLKGVVQGLPEGCVRVVDESTAAALGYAVTEPGAVVLVIDFGGGTLDMSLVRLPEGREKTGKVLFSDVRDAGANRARVIAKAGVTLGGSDIDQWLLAELLYRVGMDAGSIGEDYAAALSACEAAKIALSTAETTGLAFTTTDGRDVRITLTRSELEALMTAHGFYAALRGSLKKVMALAHQKGVYREDIRHVLLVGGSALIPSVQQTLDAFFRDITRRRRKSITQLPAWPARAWNVENTSIRVDKPFTAVVEGALQVSAGLGLDDRMAHGYGLRHRDPSASEPQYDEIVSMGSSYPITKPVRVQLAASRPGQQAIELVIGQIDTEALSTVEVKYEGGQSVFVAQAGAHSGRIVPLNEAHPFLVPLEPPGQPGVPRLQADFSVDASRGLHVSVTDLRTRRKPVRDGLVLRLGDGLAGSRDEPGSSGNEPLLIRTKGGARPAFRLSLSALASALNLLPPEQVSVQAAEAALYSDDCMVRFGAAELLSRRADRDARLAFENVLAGGTAHQRASAAQHLFRFSWFAAEPLYRRALADEDPRVAEAAVFSLCKMRLPQAYQLVLEILESGTDALRMAAVWGLHSRPDPAAVPVLERALNAENPEIRITALEVLGATETPDAIPVVRAALRDAHPEVKYAATLSWVELAREQCLADVAREIEQARGADRRWILRGLFHAANYMGIEIGASPDFELLLKALRGALCDELPETRLAAIMPLVWARHPGAAAAVVQAFHDEGNSEVKARILIAAVHLMSPAAAGLMDEALGSADPLVRQTAEGLRKSAQPS